MIAIHKQRFGKARSPIHGIHYKYKIREKSQQQLVGPQPELGHTVKSKQQAQHSKATGKGNTLGGPPQNFLMALYKQLIEVFKSFFAAGQRRICLNAIFAHLL